jgi:ankyrin repeat protein
MIAALLAHGADPNAPLNTWTPTRRSSKDYHFQPALVGATPFWLAARFCQPEVMKLLAKRGADPLFVHTSKYIAGERFDQRVEKTTPILAALGMGGGTPWVPIPAEDREALTLETIKAAAELGGDLMAANTDGRTALQAARAIGYESVVKYLEQR